MQKSDISRVFDTGEIKACVMKSREEQINGKSRGNKVRGGKNLWSKYQP